MHDELLLASVRDANDCCRCGRKTGDVVLPFLLVDRHRVNLVKVMYSNFEWGESSFEGACASRPLQENLNKLFWNPSSGEILFMTADL
jgi:hypothetical protein